MEGSALKDIERIEREEERRGNKVEAPPNRNRDRTLHHSLFGVLCVTVS